MQLILLRLSDLWVITSATRAGQSHRSDSALLSAGRAGDPRWAGIGPGRAAGQRGSLRPGELPGRHPAIALRPRPGAPAVVGSGGGARRGGGAVLVEAGGGRGDAGEGGEAGRKQDTETVEGVFVSTPSDAVISAASVAAPHAQAPGPDKPNPVRSPPKCSRWVE